MEKPSMELAQILLIKNLNGDGLPAKEMTDCTLLCMANRKVDKFELPCTFDKGKVKASMLHGNKAVKVEQDAKRNMCVIDVSSVHFNEPATVVELQGKWSL